MSDRESDVREVAAKSLSILICFCCDTQKLPSLVDSSLQIIVDEGRYQLKALLKNVGEFKKIRKF